MVSLPVELIVALGAVFLLVAIVAGAAVSRLLGRQSVAQRRLGALVGPASTATVVLHGSLTTGRDPVLARWSKLLPKSVKGHVENRAPSRRRRNPLDIGDRVTRDP